MRDPGTVQLDGVIVHMLNPEGRELVPSERTLPLDDDLRAYFVGHVKNSLEDSSAKAARFKKIDEQAVSGICAALLGGTLDLVSGSQRLAERLYGIMSNDRRISPGDLVVCFYQATNYANTRHLALLKLDPSEVFRHTTKTDEQGQRYVGFEVETAAMPTGQYGVKYWHDSRNSRNAVSITNWHAFLMRSCPSLSEVDSLVVTVVSGLQKGLERCCAPEAFRFLCYHLP